MNNKLELQLARGFRDFPPEEKILRNKIITLIKDVFEIYGFSPLETPTIERLDILEAKFVAGQDSDAISEIYRFKDQGLRELGLRYEFTFALARFIGMNPQLRLPFKRYQIGPVFRDGPIKSGRYREFYQCDVDIVGAKTTLADAEIIALMVNVFKKLNLEVVIEINHRKLLEDIIKSVVVVVEDITKEDYKKKQTSIIITIDKLKKIGKEEVKLELLKKKIPEEKINKLLDILLVEGTNLEKLNKISKIVGEEKESIIELKELFEYLKILNINYLFLPSLARGLGYYTGPIFEVFLKDETIMSSSIAGGGRWDKMIGNYLNKESNSFPATGVSFGLEPIMEIIKNKEGLGSSTIAKLLIIPIGKKNLKSSILITEKIRENKIPTIIDLVGKSIGKNLEYANKLKIPFVGFLGDNEIKENKIKIKNMITGKEELLEVSKIKDFIF